MQITLPHHYSELIREWIRSGRFESEAEAVTAGLRKLEEESSRQDPRKDFPVGSLSQYYTAQENEDERGLAKASTTRVEDGF